MASLKRFATLGGAAAVNTDPQFNLTTLLLHGDGTNGAQNNTFIDSSSNNFTITRAGNATQGTFTPFSQTGWSNYISASFLATAANTAFAFGTGNFTIEGWFYNTGTTVTTATIIGATNYGTASNFIVYLNGSTNQLVFYGPTGITATASSIPTNAWVNFAAVRSGTTVTLYINGIASATSTDANSIGSTLSLTIGNAQNNNVNAQFVGYVSNIRITKGGALYTSNYTPSTTPLTTTVSAGTVSLLTSQSNRFKDNSSNNFAWTLTGTPSVQAFSPFAPTSAYSTSVVGGSGYFDGSGDNLTITTSPTNFYSALGDWTWEAWVYPLSFSGPQFGCGIMASSLDSVVVRVLPTTASSGNLNIYAVNAAGAAMLGATGTNGSVTIKLNTWSHVVFQRRSGEFDLFLNGTRVANNTTQTAVSIRTTDTAFYIGRAASGTNPFWNGYISGVFTQNGTAKYSGTTYTIPTAPPSSTGAAICANFTDAGIIDNTSKINLETVGNAQISTSVKKYGTGSLAFDGSGDWLTFPNNPITQLGTGDFTIEGWIYINSIGVAYGLISKGTSTTGWSVNVTSGNTLQFSYTATNLTGATSLSANTWYYFAVVRSGTATGNLKIYLDGTVDATSAGAVTDNFNQTNIGYIGANRTGAAALNAYIDDLRITKYARYTANFTPPTAALLDQ